MSDFEITNGPVRIRVQGLSRTVRKLEKAGADSGEMRELMHRTGQIVVSNQGLPQLSGKLATTVRAGRGKTKAVVRAGGRGVPYAGVINYGWPARGIAPAATPLQATVQQQTPVILETIDDGINEILRKVGLL